ncbi:hypothetical protein L1278_001692 [Pontibacter sp. HSC-36F09]|nr:hypothetical protein [Pontibacter sp. HSC-36F09]
MYVHIFAVLKFIGIRYCQDYSFQANPNNENTQVRGRFRGIEMTVSNGTSFCFAQTGGMTIIPLLKGAEVC